MLRYLTISVAVLICVAALYAMLSLLWVSGDATSRTLFASLSAAYLAVLLGTLAAAIKGIGMSGERLVAAACALIPLLWILGCLDRGFTSGIETISVIAIAVISVCQWVLFVRINSNTETQTDC